MDERDFRARLADTIAAHVEELDAEASALAADAERYRRMLELLTVQPNGSSNGAIQVSGVSQDMVGKVMGALERAEGPLTVRQLAEKARVQPNRLYRVLEAAQRAGAVRVTGHTEQNARLWARA
jgi:hypothetical protein